MENEKEGADGDVSPHRFPHMQDTLCPSKQVDYSLCGCSTCK